MCKQISDIIDKINLDLTCISCPEQYNAEYKGDLIAYLRLRWGYFAVYHPWLDGEIIYAANIGNAFTGSFTSSAEREFHLAKAKEVIAKVVII